MKWVRHYLMQIAYLLCCRIKSAIKFLQKADFTTFLFLSFVYLCALYVTNRTGITVDWIQKKELSSIRPNYNKFFVCIPTSFTTLLQRNSDWSKKFKELNTKVGCTCEWHIYCETLCHNFSHLTLHFVLPIWSSTR